VVKSVLCYTHSNFSDVSQKNNTVQILSIFCASMKNNFMLGDFNMMENMVSTLHY